MPEQQKSCQISVDSGENVSRQSDRQTDRPTGGSCNFNYDSVSYQRQDKEKAGGKEGRAGSGGNRLAIN